MQSVEFRRDMTPYARAAGALLRLVGNDPARLALLRDWTEAHRSAGFTAWAGRIEGDSIVLVAHPSPAMLALIEDLRRAKGAAA